MTARPKPSYASATWAVRRRRWSWTCPPSPVVCRSTSSAAPSSPPIGQLTYLLTLPPYGSFWFLLATEAALPSWHSAPPEPLPEYATLVVRGELSDLIAPANRAVIEREALPAYLPKRRWFASKGDRLVSVSIAYAVALPGSTTVGFTEIETTFADRSEFYVMPMGVVWEDEMSGALPQQLALTPRAQGAARRLPDGWLRAGRADPWHVARPARARRRPRCRTARDDRAGWSSARHPAWTGWSCRTTSRSGG